MSALLPLLFLWLTTAAHAGNEELCFQVLTNFAAGHFEGGDYWSTNGDRPLRGLHVTVTDNTTSTAVFSDYVDDDGCITLSLSHTTDYSISYETRIEVDGEAAWAWFCDEETANPVDPTAYYTDHCRDDIDAWSLRSEEVEDDLQPLAITFTRHHTYNVTPNAQTLWLAVVARILDVDDWDLPSTCPLEFFELPFGLGGCGIVRTNDGYELPPGAQVCSTYNATNAPWVTAHETGHAIAFRLEAGEHNDCPCGCDAAGLNGQIDTTAAKQGCNGQRTGEIKGMFQKEYQATAAREGWADFVAALAFNDPTETGCRFHMISAADVDLDYDPGDLNATPYPISYYLDNAENNGFDLPEFSSLKLIRCNGIPLTSTACSNWTTEWGVTACEDTSMASYITGKDWLDDVIGGSQPISCHGTLTNRSTEFDWLRFWWDLRNEDAGQGIPTSTLLDILDAMDPRSWDPDDNTTGSDGLTGTSDDVTVRLDGAAAATPCPSPHTFCDTPVDAEKDNGQDH